VNQGVTKDILRYFDGRKRLFLFRLGIEPVGIIAHKCTSIISDKSQRKRCYNDNQEVMELDNPAPPHKSGSTTLYV